MQLTKHDGLETVVTLSERNITELFENMHNPNFQGLVKLQLDEGNTALDYRFVRVVVERKPTA